MNRRTVIVTLTALAIVLCVAAVVSFIMNWGRIETLSGTLGIAAFGVSMLALFLKRLTPRSQSRG